MEEQETVNTVIQETNVETHLDVGSDNPQESIDVAQIKAELDRLRSTNSRLLEESKKYKNQKREIDLKLLEAEGKKDEIIQTLQRELEANKEVLQAKREKEIQHAIATAVAQRANKYGCEDWDHLMVLGRTDLLEFDEETGMVKGVDNFYENALSNDRLKKFFVKMDKVKTNNKVPSFESVDWKSDPLPYLRQLKKEGKIAEYNKAIQDLEKSGLLK